MSLLSARLPAHASLYLAPERVALRLAGLIHQATVAEPGWAGALATVQELLVGRNVAGRLAVVLSQQFAPIWLLPGAPARLSQEETRGWVESRLAERFGEIAANWQIAFRPAPTGEPILASGIDRGEWAALMQILKAAGIQAASVTSWPALALAQFGRRHAPARLALLEAGRLTLASLAHGDLVGLDSARVEAAGPGPLSGLLSDLATRAALVDGLGAAPLLLVATGVAGTAAEAWPGAQVLANSLEQGLLPVRGELDFLAARPRPPLAAWLLLAAGLGLAGLAGNRYLALAETQAALEQEHPAAVAKPKRAAAVGDPFDAARSRSWDALLRGLEARRPAKGADQIALLSLRGDAIRGEAQLTAEARSEVAMLAWLKALRTRFADASLVQHSVQKDAEQQPLRFDIRLHWGAQ